MSKKKNKNSNYKANVEAKTVTNEKPKMSEDTKKNIIIWSSVAAIILGIVLIAVLSNTVFSKTNKMGTGACEYLESRDISGRDIKYVEICIEDYGKMVVLLDATTAPKTVENFIDLVEDGFYNGLTLHRVVKDFMVQGGDPKGDGTGGADKDLFGEFSSNGHENDISHKYGVISMARSTDPDSASSQFFICNADASSSLDGDYAAFGYVVEGMSVVDEITKKVFPKTAYADYYKDYTVDSYYGTYKHYVWQYLGNGNVEKASDKPVIKYIKVLDSWEK